MKPFSKKYFEFLFYVGLLLGTVVSFNNIYDFLNDFSEGMFKSVSIVFILIGGWLSHSDKFKKKNDLHERDERLGLIRGKAYEWMFFISMIIAVIAAIIFAIIGGIYVYISITISFFLFLERIIYYLLYYFFNKKF